MTAPSTKSQLQAGATLVRDETRQRQNTANRVGSELLNIVNAMPQIIDVSTYGASPSNDGATNDVALALAIAAALASGSQLYWPEVYPSAASLANLHSVRHRGPGGLLRGTDTFYVEPSYARSNSLYVAITGSSANDGITSAEPMRWQDFAAVLSNYGPTLDGTWTIQVAAGTHQPVVQATLDALRSRNPIRFRGPAVGGSPNVPTAIIDGTGSSGGVAGLSVRNGVNIDVQDIKFQNWSSTDGCGVIGDRHCVMLCTNVHTSGNDLAGIDAESHTRLYVSGGIHSGNNFYNIRAYGQCLVTIGYGGSHSSNRCKVGGVLNGGGGGVLIRDASTGHVDFTDFDGVGGSSGALNLINFARAHLVDCVFGGTGANYYNVRLDDQSTYIDSGSTFNAATSRSIVQFGFSLDNASNQYVYWDVATHRLRIGAQTDSLTPGAPLHLLQAAQAGVTNNYNSNVLYAIESTTPYMAFGGDSASEGGLMWARNGDNRRAQLGYSFASDYMLLRVAAVDSFQWSQTYYRPVVTNAVELGQTGQTWSKLWLGAGNVQILSGTGSPAGVVTANPGSIFLRTDGGAGTTLYLKESGTGTAGWVAK